MSAHGCLSGAAGTLLDSNSKVLPSSVSAIKAALDQGVLVCLATGKARPAAISALQSVGLAGTPLALHPASDCIVMVLQEWFHVNIVQLACVRPAASIHPEPGSNSFWFVCPHFCRVSHETRHDL